MNTTKMYRQLCLISLISVAISAIGAKMVRMENPLVEKTNTAKLFIDAIELTPDSTTVTLHTYCYLGNNINIQPSVKLLHEGKSYPLRSARGIELGKTIDISMLGDTIFTLSFEPLPMKTKSFDFIEGDGDNDFRLEGVHTDKTVDSQTPLESLNVLPTQKWEKGTAILKGKIMNYQPSEEESLVKVYPRSAIGSLIDKKIGVSVVNPDGSFEVNLPIFQSYEPCFFTAPGFYGLIYLSPDKESYVTIDKTQRWSNGHQGKDGSVAFSGENEELNNQLALNIGHDMVWDVFINNWQWKKKYPTASEYKSDLLRHAANRKEKIKKLPFTPMMKQLMDISIDLDITTTLLDRSTTNNFEEIDSSYYDCYRSLDVDNPEIMWSDGFDSFINYSYNPYTNDLNLRIENIEPEYYSYLIENNIVKDNDKELAQSLISNNLDCVPKEVVNEYAQAAIKRVMHYRDSLNLQGSENAKSEVLIDKLKNGEIKKYNDVRSHYLNWLLNLRTDGHEFSFQEAADIPFENAIIEGIQVFHSDNDSIISAFNSKYDDIYQMWKFEKDIDKAIENFTKLHGKESSLMNQLFASQAYIRYIERRNTLSDRYIANCRKRLPDMFFDYVMDQNNAMAKTLQATTYNVLETNPENSGEQVLKDIAEKFKGKVIYIDIWGTWCSPCLSAINEIQPIKKDYSENVAFVYLADETSPKNTWEEKIKSIEGEHMRLSQSQAQDLKNKFALRGYPSYIVIGKDGSIVFSGSLHGLHNIKKLFDEEIAK